MTGWEQHGVTLLLGDVIARLADLPDESVDCVVTSPPYWGLRDYGVDGQLGLEQTLQEHLDKMIEVFREVRRVLKPSGTCFVNYGDCYATSPNGRSAADAKAAGSDDRTFRDKPFSTVGPVCAEGSPSTATRGSNSANKQSSPLSSKRVMAGGYMKPKDLCMVPNRFAIAMQDDGWWVRSEIIWAKPNPMPESVKDRPATAHEKIFLFTKSARYDWDAEEARQNRVQDENARGFRGGSYVGGVAGPRKNKGNDKTPKDKRTDKQRGHSRRHSGFNDRWDAMPKEEQQAGGRSLRNYEPQPVHVWKIATRPFKDAHFATFPPELVERCLNAGCHYGGHVLDPFGGAGTTGLVSMAMGRSCTLIEINPEYAEISRKRIASVWMGSAEKTWAFATDTSADDLVGTMFEALAE